VQLPVFFLDPIEVESPPDDYLYLVEVDGLLVNVVSAPLDGLQGVLPLVVP